MKGEMILVWVSMTIRTGKVKGSSFYIIVGLEMFGKDRVRAPSLPLARFGLGRSLAPVISPLSQG